MNKQWFKETNYLIFDLISIKRAIHKYSPFLRELKNVQTIFLLLLLLFFYSYISRANLFPTHSFWSFHKLLLLMFCKPEHLHKQVIRLEHGSVTIPQNIIDRPTNQPTNWPTNPPTHQRTERVIGKLPTTDNQLCHGLCKLFSINTENTLEENVLLKIFSRTIKVFQRRFHFIHCIITWTTK